MRVGWNPIYKGKSGRNIVKTGFELTNGGLSLGVAPPKIEYINKAHIIKMTGKLYYGGQVGKCWTKSVKGSLSELLNLHAHPSHTQKISITYGLQFMVAKLWI